MRYGLNSIARNAAFLWFAAIMTLIIVSSASGQSATNRRHASAHCLAPVAAFSGELHKAERRLKRTGDKPGAEEQRAAILAKALSGKYSALNLSELLSCLDNGK